MLLEGRAGEGMGMGVEGVWDVEVIFLKTFGIQTSSLTHGCDKTPVVIELQQKP